MSRPLLSSVVRDPGADGSWNRGGSRQEVRLEASTLRRPTASIFYGRFLPLIHDLTCHQSSAETAHQDHEASPTPEARAQSQKNYTSVEALPAAILNWGYFQIPQLLISYSPYFNPK
ncbi:hypothetical protein NDU88_006808 [Pleurodeles waltl]|uniref:Uncharacterized protein n=1 Tax=Pleurodeles waltl TaxID=8319 RepID=A0AAV7PKQ4_PLEWA|nr:hypothetical protein NDU88_006808 [Pleurodeles waltl]